MAKLTIDQLRERIYAGDLSEAEARRLFKGNKPESEAFAPALVLNEAAVEVGDAEERTGSAFLFNFLNASEREGRRLRFERRVAEGDTSPVVLSEGDSWFQFPVLLKDVIDGLEPDFLTYSLDAAGDTLKNMVFDNAEYLIQLRQLRHRFAVRALLISGAGNDIIGADPDGISVLERVVKPFDPTRSDPSHAPFYIDTDAFRAQLMFVRDAHVKVFSDVLREFPEVRVVCHGYAYAIPGGFTHDPRDPVYARRDQWLGRPFNSLGFPRNQSQALRRAIVKEMLDQLNSMQKTLCGGNSAGGRFANAYHVDVRNVVADDEWNDEIHPTNAGFKKVVGSFRTLLDSFATGV
jgi:hypothetical protein